MQAVISKLEIMRERILYEPESSSRPRFRDGRREVLAVEEKGSSSSSLSESYLNERDF